MPTPTHAQQLLSLLARTSFKLGHFKLSSGGTSDYYIDCRTTTLHAEGGRLTGHAILELLEANKKTSQTVIASACGPLRTKSYCNDWHWRALFQWLPVL
jgi:orotate phosphoribosyltransferase